MTYIFIDLFCFMHFFLNLKVGLFSIHNYISCFEILKLLFLLFFLLSINPQILYYLVIWICHIHALSRSYKNLRMKNYQAIYIFRNRVFYHLRNLPRTIIHLNILFFLHHQSNFKKNSPHKKSFQFYIFHIHVFFHLKNLLHK